MSLAKWRTRAEKGGLLKTSTRFNSVKSPANGSTNAWRTWPFERYGLGLAGPAGVDILPT